MNYETARASVQDHLQAMQKEMNSFGSGLPDFIQRTTRLVIVDVEEHDIGWVFFYATEEYQRTGDHRDALAGNAPLLIDRLDGSLHVMGTAHAIEHYLEQYRRDRSSLPAVPKPAP